MAPHLAAIAFPLAEKWKKRKQKQAGRVGNKKSLSDRGGT